MKKISTILEKRNYYKTLESSHICFVAQKELDKIFGAKKISVISYRNGNLKIRAENNYLLSEIRMKQGEIIFEVNKKFKNNKIRKVSFN